MTELDDVYKEVAKDLNVKVEDVKKAYKLYWKSIREKIEALDIHKGMSEEEFSKLRTCFNISHLGKLNCTYKRYVGVTKKLSFKDKLNENK